MGQHRRGRVDSDLYAERRGEAAAAHTDLEAETLPGDEGAQRQQLRPISRLVLFEPSFIALVVSLDGRLQSCSFVVVVKLGERLTKSD
jgi:hypothetical protein